MNYYTELRLYTGKCLIKFGILCVLLFGTTKTIGNIFTSETRAAICSSFRNSKN
jgi:hypothetical protein